MEELEDFWKRQSGPFLEGCFGGARARPKLEGKEVMRDKGAVDLTSGEQDSKEDRAPILLLEDAMRCSSAEMCEERKHQADEDVAEALEAKHHDFGDSITFVQNVKTKLGAQDEETISDQKLEPHNGELRDEAEDEQDSDIDEEEQQMRSPVLEELVPMPFDVAVFQPPEALSEDFESSTARKAIPISERTCNGSRVLHLHADGSIDIVVDVEQDTHLDAGRAKTLEQLEKNLAEPLEAIKSLDERTQELRNSIRQRLRKIGSVACVQRQQHQKSVKSTKRTKASEGRLRQIVNFNEWLSMSQNPFRAASSEPSLIRGKRASTETQRLRSELLHRAKLIQRSPFHKHGRSVQEMMATAQAHGLMALRASKNR
ncbi:unnamed protein product [Durusdinium trenchii]|uniref:Uncharacterized protein n=1 Tax=Durusdinium trenchii TaxID=1381693 RepID=A0ABP0S965_9DINO